MKTLGNISTWNPAAGQASGATAELEPGGLLLLPKLAFELSPAELALLDPRLLSGSRKNISYDLGRDRLAGIAEGEPQRKLLHGLVRRYAESSRALVDALFPHYQPALVQGRSSFRPAEIQGRVSSPKKDDTRLHVDAFPATPVQGKRLLRVFTNINQQGRPRHWRVGEPFAEVARRFAAGVEPKPAALRRLMQWTKITKSYRTAYDDLMLQVHDRMKLDLEYQRTVKYQEIFFQPGQTWIVCTDQVSHAALAGQHLMEQTFYLPAEAMQQPEHSPLRQLEKLKNRPLLN